MHECLSPEQLSRYVASTATDLDVQPLERHIDGCELCRRNVAAVVRANRDSAPRLDAGIAVGTRIGRYVIRAARGRGAMGSVFEADDPDLDRVIAIKVVHNLDAMTDTRALREGRALARLSHPNVVGVHDVGIWSGGVFLAMELVRGRSLREWLSEPRPWREIVRLFAAVASGLRAAHAAGLVHRDIKPDNLVVGDDDRVRIIDFGLAIADRASGAVLAGTPAYMAPEQRSGTADARSDQYAFMVTLYEALEAKRPGDDAVFTRRTPMWLRLVIRRGLRADPAARFPDMAAVERALRRGLGQTLRRGAALAGVAVVAGATAFVVTTHDDSVTTCEVPELTGAWDPPKQLAIERALLASHVAYGADTWHAVARELDRYTGEWQAMYADACKATHERHEQSAELLDLRMACLRDRLVHVRALGDVLAGGGPDIARKAVAATLALDPVAECADAVALRAVSPLPRDPAARQRLAAARQRLEDARALFDTGRAAKARDAIAAIPEIGYAPYDTERLMLVGRIQRQLGNFDASLDAFRAAARAADAGGVDRTRINALLEMADVAGIRKGNLEQALELAKDAEALIARAHDPLGRAQLLRVRGSVLSRRTGHDDDAIRDLRESLAGYEHELGPNHLSVANTLNVLGNALFRAGKLDEAEAVHRRSLAIREAALGPRHPDVAGAIANLGSMQLEQRDFAGAEAAFRRAISIASASLGPDVPDVALFRMNLALVLEEQHRFAESLPEWQAAVRIYRELTHGAFSLDFVHALTGTAQSELGLEHGSEALAAAGEAMKLVEGRDKDITTASLADTRFAYGRALWLAGGDRKKAREEVQWAREVWAKGGHLKIDELAAADAWLKSH